MTYCFSFQSFFIVQKWGKRLKPHLRVVLVPQFAPKNRFKSGAFIFIRSLVLKHDSPDSKSTEAGSWTTGS